MGRCLSAIGVVAIALMWFVPGVSHAATVRVEGRALIYTATGSNENTLEVSGPGCFDPFQVPCPPQIHLTDFGGVFGRSSAGEPILPGAGCEYQTPPPPPGQPPPPGPPPPVPIDRDVLCSAEVDLFDISLAGGDDWLFVSTDTPGVLRGDADDDRIEDGNGNDLVLGGTGNDVFLRETGQRRSVGRGGGLRLTTRSYVRRRPSLVIRGSNSALDTGKRLVLRRRGARYRRFLRHLRERTIVRRLARRTMASPARETTSAATSRTYWQDLLATRS